MTLHNLYKSFQVPTMEEGIDVIKIYGQDLNLQKIPLPDWVIRKTRPGRLFITGRKLEEQKKNHLHRRQPFNI